MTVSSGSLLRAMRVPSRSENSRSHAIQRSRSMCLRVPVHDRCAMLPSPGRLNCAHCGFGHEKRVYLSWTGVVSVIAVLLCAGLDQKILIRRQFFHVPILPDYQTPQQKLFEKHMEIVTKNFASQSQNVIWAQTIVSLQENPIRPTENSVVIVKTYREGNEIRHTVEDY